MREPIFVLLIGNYENDRQTSMQRFASVLAEQFPRAGVAAELIRPEPFFGRIVRSDVGIGKWLGYLDKFLLFPFALKRRIKQLQKERDPVSPNADRGRRRSSEKSSGELVVHICDHSNAHYTRYLQHLPHLVTCNDFLAIRSAAGEFPLNPTRWTGRRLQQIILGGLRRARHITCISEATKKDLLRVGRVHPDDASVTYMGQNFEYRPIDSEAVASRIRELLAGRTCEGEIHDRGYILHVGSNHWYKNRSGVIRIYHQLTRVTDMPPFLIFAGMPLSDELQKQIEHAGLAKLVVELPDVAADDLRVLYAGAKLLLFPSLEEGFGWPIIEAQACRCRVVTTNKAPMTEVAGDAAAFIDPENAVQSAIVVKQVLEEGKAEREKAIESGMRNSSGFSTQRMISSYETLYRRLIRSEEDREERVGAAANRGDR